MRAGPQAQLLASGEYEYLRDGVSVPVYESWQLSRTARGLSLFSHREVPAASLVISAKACFAGAGLQRCYLQWCSGAALEPVAKAFYTATPAVSRYRYRGHGARTQSIDAQNAHFFPLMRVFAGGVIHGLAAGGGSGRVLVPWIHDPSMQQRLFEPEFSDRSVRQLGSEKDPRLDHFHYSGGRYESGADYWLLNGLLQEYRWQQGDAEWTVRLKNPAGVWPGEEVWGRISAAESA
ncbi:hypothetical protein Maes01_02035 [Microbulbifer aestuariivivens]|uniref:Uncharacterized protein n=2 Tax=Microbulbifer aestuariivivens TaxID=1908308 RepID=A0ABP9WQU8_9GAMM